MEIEDIASLYESEMESHFVHTEDGYINTIFRIRNHRAQENKTKAVVMLMHGFVDSSDTFCINGRDKSPAFILADAGYDVWLTNSRGNKHSLGHQTLDSATDVEYWEGAMGYYIAEYDIPSFIEYIKAESGVDSLSIMAHSQATNLLLKNMA